VPVPGEGGTQFGGIAGETHFVCVGWPTIGSIPPSENRYCDPAWVCCFDSWHHSLGSDEILNIKILTVWVLLQILPFPLHFNFALHLIALTLMFLWLFVVCVRLQWMYSFCLSLLLIKAGRKFSICSGFWYWVFVSHVLFSSVLYYASTCIFKLYLGSIKKN